MLHENPVKTRRVKSRLGKNCVKFIGGLRGKFQQMLANRLHPVATDPFEIILDDRQKFLRLFLGKDVLGVWPAGPITLCARAVFR